MGLMDDLKKVTPTTLGGTNKQFIDADTLVDSDTNEKYRIQGINAPEVEKFIDGRYKTGTAGGEVATDTVVGLANNQGFTNVTPLLDENGEIQRDDFGRILADLTDENGVSFKTRVLEEGVFDPNKYTTDEDYVAWEIAKAKKDKERLEGRYTEDEWANAAETIQDGIYAEGGKRLGFKQAAVDEATLAWAKQNGLGYLFAEQNVQVRSYDRDLNNNSLNPLSDAWDQGWTGVTESSYGVLNLLGETTGSEWLSEVGEAGVERAQARLGDKAKILVDYKDVNSFGTAAEFLGNNLALSIPYMAATVVGTAAAPVTYGTSLALPVSLYTGQTWNEMEGEKNAAVAVASGVAQATLDRVGLGAILGGLKGKASKDILQAGINELMKKGLSKEAAEQTIMQASRRELANLAGEAAKVAKRQLAAKKLGMDLLKRTGVGAGAEGITEGLQEATAYLGAVYGSDKQFNWEELNERVIAGAVAGSALGGALSVPGTAYDAGAWADVAYRLQGADPASQSQSFQYAEEERARHGYLPTIEQNAAEARVLAEATPSQFTLEDRATADAERRQKQGTWNEAAERLGNIQSLWQGSVRNILTPNLQQKSRSARVLADMFGGNLQRIFAGSNYENTKHHRVAIYKNMVDLPQNFYAGFNNGKKSNQSMKNQISDRVYKTLQTAVDKDGNFDPSKIPESDPMRQQIIKLGNDLNVLSNKMYADQKKYSPDLGYVKNYLHKYKALDKAAIEKNRRGFEAALKKEFKMTDAAAAELTHNIIDNPEINDVDEAFSVVRGGFKPTSHKKRSLGLSEKEAFKEFMDRDIFSNVSKAAKAASRFTAHREFVGENGKIITQLLDQMEAEGVSRAEVDKVAAGMKNYLDAESGNYKRPTSDAGRRAVEIQKNFMLWTTFAGLPLATVSSFVELGLSSRALTKDQIFGKKGSLRTAGREIMDTIASMGKNIASLATNKEVTVSQTSGKQRLRDLGFYEWDVGAATTTGVTEVSQTKQYYLEQFFKWTGLQGWTNYTRAIRGAIASDYMLDKAQTIYENELAGEGGNRETAEAKEALLNLGVDPVQFTAIQTKLEGKIPLTPEEEAFMEQSAREGTYNFINDAVALPSAANRPLIYQDPRFALFTQFQGFMATFTANHIPRLWGEYVKRGTPAMKYNAFAVMTTMIMLGFASQYLKDLIKYGTTENPYLDKPEYIQRGIRSSGLLGTSERVLDLFFPLYGDSRTDGPVDWVFTQTRSESPALSNIARLGKGVGRFIEGDVGEGVRNVAKTLPIVGPLSGLTTLAGEGASNWNFKGE